MLYEIQLLLLSPLKPPHPSQCSHSTHHAMDTLTAAYALVFAPELQACSLTTFKSIEMSPS